MQPMKITIVIMTFLILLLIVIFSIYFLYRNQYNKAGKCQPLI